MRFLKFEPFVLHPRLRPDQHLDIALLYCLGTGRRDDDWRTPPSPSLPRFLRRIKTSRLYLALAYLALKVRRKATTAIPMPTPRKLERLAHPLILPTNRTEHQLLPQMTLDNL
jgi:hypothetical protein